MKKIIKRLILLALPIWLWPGTGEAARMFWEITPDQPAVGEVLMASLYLDTEGESLNAVEGQIHFSSDFLDLKEIRDAGSFLNFWLESPILKDGQIVFSGVTPGGFVSQRGQILSVIFAGRQAGPSNLEIRGQQTLRNDGYGTAAYTVTSPLTVTILPTGSGVTKFNFEEEDYLPPEVFTPLIAQDKLLFGNKKFVVFATQDKQSGVRGYSIKESPSRFLAWFYPWRQADSPEQLSDQSGRGYVWLRAVDHFGNKRIIRLDPIHPLGWYENLDFWVMILLMLGLVWLTRFALLRKVFSFLFLLGFYWLWPGGVASAASLFISPESGTYSVGENFSVNVVVNSTDQAMNAASGALSFPVDKLEVLSLSKAASLFSLWVQEPTFSNASGQINFEGIVLNPGFVGAGGRVLTVNFKTKASGVAELKFISGSILANDGEGTNILTGLGVANFGISPSGPAAPNATTPVPAGTVGTPLAPEIHSETHPNPDEWYNSREARFNWILPPDVNAGRLLIGHLPQATPSVYYSPAINTRTVSNLEDGIWYFHAQLKNSAGWGAVAHFRLQVDATKPKLFTIKPVGRNDLTEPTASFVFEAEDETSGIDRYEIELDSQDVNVWRPESPEAVFTTPALPSGRHTLLVKAIDRAGNYLADSVEFEIEALEPPLITNYPQTLMSDEVLIIGGQTYPRSQVLVSWQNEVSPARYQTIHSDAIGRFSLVLREKLPDGIYQIWAEVVDARGARSAPSDKVVIAVTKPAWLRLGSEAVVFLAVLIPLLALMVILLLIVWSTWHYLTGFRRRVRKEAREAELMVHQAFGLLRESIHERVRLLEKTSAERQLTEAEERILRQFRHDLDEAERFISKEVEDIHKETE